MWYAQSTASDQSGWEPLRDHLEAVATRADRFAERFGAGELAREAGLLHDPGKYDENFLRRLEDNSVWHEHSTAGACIAAARYGAIRKLLAYAIETTQTGGLG